MYQNQNVRSYQEADDEEGLTPELWKQIQVLFHSALELPPTDRVSFLNEACGDAPGLREKVDALLAADEDSNEFFRSPFLNFPLIGNRVSHYQIEKKIGAGGMGEVYLARDSRLDRVVALKILPPGFVQDEERMRRFVIESKAASAVSHSNVAHIYEIGEENGIHFIAMEFVGGETLATTIRSGRANFMEVASIGIQIARALEGAHSRGIIHRDLKPANIMITPAGEVKLLDFGVAKVSFSKDRISSRTSPSISSETQAGLMLGTVPYTSPEQLLGKPVDHRTDFFSLGVVLYELATQRLPFEGKTTIEISDSILHHECAAPNQLNHSIPEPLSRIILKLLAKDPRRRYENAGEIISALQAVQQLHGIRKWIAFHAVPQRFQSISFVVVLVMTLVVVGWQFSGLLKATGRSNAAKSEKQAKSVQLSTAPKVNAAAYQAYLRGLDYTEREIKEENLRMAAAMFEKAVELDPGFAAAYAQLSIAHGFLYFTFERTAERLEKSKAAVHRAFQLQPGIAEGHMALGYYYYRGLRDYDLALREFSIAQKRLPNNKAILATQGTIYRRQGKWKEALAAGHKEVALNPGDALSVYNLGITYAMLRKYEEAQHYFDLCISWAPDEENGYASSFENQIHWKGNVNRAREILNRTPVKNNSRFLRAHLFAELLDRRYEDALNILENPDFDPERKALMKGIVNRLRNRDELARADFESARRILEKELKTKPNDAGIHSRLGMAYAGLGRKHDAIYQGKQAVELLPVSKDAVWGPDFIQYLAHIYIMVGEYDLALDQIEYLLAIPGPLSVPELRMDPRWDPLRGFARFQKLLES